MASEILHYESARFAQQLFGNDPKNLKAVEAELGLKVTARDSSIKLEGPPQAVEQAKKLFTSLANQHKNGAHIRHREFANALAVLTEHGGEALDELSNDHTHTSPQRSPIAPKTVGQKKYVDAIRTHDVTFGIGPAGTGKTYLAVAMALAALRDGQVSRIILSRPAVEAGEALGFLPGDLYEKITPYLRPLHDALQDMLPAEAVAKHMERNVIEIAPLAYMRGRTLNNSFIILDEAQNTTTEQMLMFLTRLGHGSKAVVTGDESQTDLPANKQSGLIEAHRALKGIEGIAIVEFTKKDVVRHALVQRIITAYEEHRGPRK